MISKTAFAVNPIFSPLIHVADSRALLPLARICQASLDNDAMS